MWIDADIEFHPNDIDRLRSHDLPMVCGIYPQKGKRAIACHIAPGTSKIAFGKEGGLVEILYAATGFLLVRREVYLTMQQHLHLPMCNERFGSPMLPFFHPVLHRCEDGHWYLAEDYAFSQRVRECGYKIMADSSIRLWHVGSYGYSWEDAGISRQRYDSFTVNFGPEPQLPQANAEEKKPELADFAKQYPWPAEKPEVSPAAEQPVLSAEMQELLSRCASPTTRLIAEVGPGRGTIARFLADLAPHAIMFAIDPWRRRAEQDSASEAYHPVPGLYETFLSECWGYRHQIIPLKAAGVEGLTRIADAGLQPDLICLGACGDGVSVSQIFTLALDLFPKATVVGQQWNEEKMRAAIERVATNRGVPVENLGAGWRVTR